VIQFPYKQPRLLSAVLLEARLADSRQKSLNLFGGKATGRAIDYSGEARSREGRAELADEDERDGLIFAL